MRNAIVISTIAALLPIAACATTDSVEEDEITLELTDESGKADSINGTQLRLRGDTDILSAATFQEPRTMTVDGADAQTTVATGSWFSAVSSTTSTSAWQHDKILDVSAEGPAGTTMAFVARLNGSEKLTCRKGTFRRNVFKSIAINIADQEIYVDDEHTFTFAECGMRPVPTLDFYMIQFFALPLHTRGALEGEYEFRLVHSYH